jgi:hypothetical protein
VFSTEPIRPSLKELGDAMGHYHYSTVIHALLRGSELETGKPYKDVKPRVRKPSKPPEKRNGVRPAQKVSAKKPYRLRPLAYDVDAVSRLVAGMDAKKKPLADDDEAFLARRRHGGVA